LELRAFIQPLVSLEDHPSCYPTTRTPVQPLFYQSSAVVMDTSFELSQYAFDPEFPVSLEEISSNDSEMELYTATGDEGKPFRLLRVHLYKQKKPDFGHILYHSATEHENDEQNSDETSSTKKSKFDAFPFHRWLMSRNT
jgi:hypothetical protein